MTLLMTNLNSIQICDNLQISPHPEHSNYGNTSSKKYIRHIIDRHELKEKANKHGSCEAEDRVALVKSTFFNVGRTHNLFIPLGEDFTEQNRSLNYNIVRDTVIESCCID